MNRNAKQTLVPHYRKCPKIKNEERDKFTDNGDLEEDAVTSTEETTATSDPGEDLNPRATKKRKVEQAQLMNGGLGKFLGAGALSPDQRRFADKILSLWSSVTGLQYLPLEHPLFKMFCKILNPSYNPPCRQTLGRSLLDKSHEEMITIVDEYLEEWKATFGPEFCIAADGSSDGSKEPVVNVVGLFPAPILLEVHRPRETAQTGKKIFEDVKKTKDAVYSKNGLIATSYHHDNEKKEQNVADFWRAEFKSGAPGCGPHAQNLINKGTSTSLTF